MLEDLGSVPPHMSIDDYCTLVVNSFSHHHHHHHLKLVESKTFYVAMTIRTLDSRVKQVFDLAEVMKILKIESNFKNFQEAPNIFKEEFLNNFNDKAVATLFFKMMKESGWNELNHVSHRRDILTRFNEEISEDEDYRRTAANIAYHKGDPIGDMLTVSIVLAMSRLYNPKEVLEAVSELNSLTDGFNILRLPKVLESMKEFDKYPVSWVVNMVGIG